MLTGREWHTALRFAYPWSISCCWLAWHRRFPLSRSVLAKQRLRQHPREPLPNEVVTRAKSGFGVPIGAWINSVGGGAFGPMGRVPETKGLGSRRWSQAVLNGAGLAERSYGVHAS